MGGIVGKPPGGAASKAAAKAPAEAPSEQHSLVQRSVDLEKEPLQVNAACNESVDLNGALEEEVRSETHAKDTETPSGGRESPKHLGSSRDQRAVVAQIQPMGQGSGPSPTKTEETGGSPAKATASYSGSTWVDNSEFRAPQDCSSGRSAPHHHGGVMRSGIVSLPQIHQRLPVNQQEMIKDLHEKIQGSLEEHPRNGPFDARKDGAPRGAGQESGAGLRRKLDVRHLMEDLDEDLDFDLPSARGNSSSAAAAAKQDGTFNAQFASCKSARPAATPRGRRGIGPSSLGPIGARIGAQAPAPAPSGSTRAF